MPVISSIISIILIAFIISTMLQSLPHRIHQRKRWNSLDRVQKLCCKIQSLYFLLICQYFLELGKSKVKPYFVYPIILIGRNNCLIKLLSLFLLNLGLGIFRRRLVFPSFVSNGRIGYFLQQWGYFFEDQSINLSFSFTKGHYSVIFILYPFNLWEWLIQILYVFYLIRILHNHNQSLVSETSSLLRTHFLWTFKSFYLFQLPQ